MRSWVVAFLVLFSASSAVRADDFSVTVVAILASDRHTNIDPKIKTIADQVRKTDQTLTGWRINRTTVKTLSLKDKESFPLVADVVAEVTVVPPDPKDEKDGKIKLNVKSAHGPEVTIRTKPEKYFPIMTRYQTDKDKERLFYAVMVKPIPAKEK